MLSDFSRATNFEESEMMLQDFLADESTEVFLEEESNIY